MPGHSLSKTGVNALMPGIHVFLLKSIEALGVSRSRNMTFRIAALHPGDLDLDVDLTLLARDFS
jgi:hypothetical protein